MGSRLNLNEKADILHPHGKSSLFHKTENRARVGDLYIGLVHTAELSVANLFDYLTQLQRHAEELAAVPSQWMSWDCREMLQRTGASADSG